MSDAKGFNQFAAGFDWMQNLAKQAAGSLGQALPHLPQLDQWIAPTLNVEELEKRIQELRTVHFWLEQNTRVLSSTIQALEVQKMTLSTLKGMDFNVADMAQAVKAKTEAAAPEHPPTIDPTQWWSAMTQQFQTIASNALKEATHQTAPDAGNQVSESNIPKTATTNKPTPVQKNTNKPAAKPKTPPSSTPSIKKTK